MCSHEWTDKTISFTAASGSEKQATNQGANGVAGICGICGICGAWRGAFGLEPTIEMYVAHTLEILRECRRVLRPDGVLFWNLGDSYHSDRGYGGDLKPSDLQLSNHGSLRGKDTFMPNRHKQNQLKPKDLCLIPARVAIAAQGDVSVRNGKQEAWWIRSMIIWTKPNPMPESVTDRPTDAYEHILMLTKSERYFWDADAVRKNVTGGTHSRGTGDGGPKAQQRGSYEGWTDGTREVLSSRNLRNVWDFATQPYPEAHFATFPEELPRLCIRAATSERGACSSCGAPWERICARQVRLESGSGKAGNYPVGKMAGESQVRDGHDVRMGPCVDSKTIGWSPTCRCPGQHGRTSPCVVLDPFTGSGTTGKVAMELGRKFVGMDLAYHELSRERIESGIPGTDAWIRRKNGVRRVPDAILPLFEENDATNPRTG